MVFNSLVQTRRFLSSSKLYDVVVVGGGMVGNAMAAALGSSPVMKESNILLLEAGKTQKLSKPSEVFSNRVSAVSPASTNLFKSKLFNSFLFINILFFFRFKYMG